jgi:hypothetical protein
VKRWVVRCVAGAAIGLAGFGCTQTYTECSTEYRADYRAKHGTSPTQTQVNNACRDRTGSGAYYGSGSRGSKRGGSYSSGGK